MLLIRQNEASATFLWHPHMVLCKNLFIGESNQHAKGGEVTLAFSSAVPLIQCQCHKRWIALSLRHTLTVHIQCKQNSLKTKRTAI